jgi:uncharacterized membrane protein
MVRSVSFSPIGPWLLVVMAALAVVVLTLWAYRQRLQGTSGRWRWVALGLRLAAVLLCVLAALRPSVVLTKKVKQTATLIFLIDSSTSSLITDEVRGQSRWEVARKAVEVAREAVKKLGPGLDSKFYRFDANLHEAQPGETAPPDGKQTALGTSLMESLKLNAGTRVASIIVFTDGNSNYGLAPLSAAQHLRSQQVPVIPVGLGSETAGTASRDIAVRTVSAAPTVFVKNELQVSGMLNVRGYPREPLEVELMVEGETKPVATTTVKAAEGTEAVPVRGLKYIPQTAGEKMITLRVKPKEGELVQSNNEISTFVTALKGGLNVLFIQGSNFSWEHKYLIRNLDASPDIRVDQKIILRPASQTRGEMDDADLAPGRYDVYILSDVPANFLTPWQRQRLVAAVENGASLMMLGGRSSFGPGGWGGTPVAGILPVEIHPGDGQLEPENGLKVIPVTESLDNYVLRLGPTRRDSMRVWAELPPIPGANRFKAKLNANVLARTVDNEPLMLSQDVGKGRVLVFAGETWVWYRASDETQLAHRKFWRQGIFWLAHKENQSESHIKLSLNKRRVSSGDKLELTVMARDAKGEPITDVKYETIVQRIATDAKPEPLALYNQGDDARGTYFATGLPGQYRVTVSASANGKDLGGDTARFLVYQDDRELENPAADHALLRQIAEMTGGNFLTPEQLGKHLKSLDGKDFTDDVRQYEQKIWDNWPFFLLFVTLLTLEWWLRKKHGWV